MKDWLFNSFKKWYKDGVATDEDLATLLKNKALTREEIDEIKNGNGG